MGGYQTVPNKQRIHFVKIQESKEEDGDEDHIFVQLSQTIEEKVGDEDDCDFDSDGYAYNQTAGENLGNGGSGGRGPDGKSLKRYNLHSRK